MSISRWHHEWPTYQPANEVIRAQTKQKYDCIDCTLTLLKARQYGIQQLPASGTVADFQPKQLLMCSNLY